MTRYEAFQAKGWAETGLAEILVARFRDDGTADCAFFLVDVFCLGVKNTICDFGGTTAEARHFIDECLPVVRREGIEPSCARKLVEGAVDYARSLGFEPFRDFRKARKVFSSVDTSKCSTDFVFGHEGRPLYVAGRDDPDRVNQVVSVLTARCGAGGFDFVVDDDDDETSPYGDDETRDELGVWLETQPERIPRMDEFSGLVTGVIAGGGAGGLDALIEHLWLPCGREALARANEPGPRSVLGEYWEQIGERVADFRRRDTPPAEAVIDSWLFWEEDEDPVTQRAVLREWATGFARAVEIAPEGWSEALARPSLAEHWAVVRQWADPRRAALARDGASSGEPSDRALANAVASLVRATG